MKVFLVVLAIFVAAAWANEEEEQDEIEVMEVEDPSYWKPKPKHCGTKKVCVTKQRCYDDLKIVTKCRKSCYVASTKCYPSYDPYGYAPKKVCKPIKKCKHICVKVPTTHVLRKICKPIKSCKYVPKKCHYRPTPYYPSMHKPHYPKPYYPRRTYKPKVCYKTKCVTKEVCKLDFFTRQQKVCTPKKYKCGYSYDYYGPKYCYKKVCKTIGINTPKKVCKPKKTCSKVPTKCPKYY